MKLNTILVPTDFSEDAEKALSTAKELAKAFGGAKIVVLHAYQVDIPIVSPMAGGYALPQGFYEDLRTQVTTRVDEVVAQLSSEGVDATGLALQEPAALAIVREAESLPADLIVMGTRGHTGLKHIVLGSVAERVVRTAPCSVLTVKAE
ncbi:MAG: universal stress protein [Myxococcales bacterium]|jgi:nucleotide-binding universal stress UspA family protein|nr:universal stress protein [Myxococcales bacterium]